MHRTELVAAVSERSGQPRNPQTGEAMTVPASSGVRLSPVTALKAQVEGRRP